MTVMVTDRQGRALEGVQVSAAGPVERDGTTEADGTVAFRNMNGGVYRLRFEHAEFITLEREVTVQPGRALRTAAALNPAPPPPPPPKQEPEPPPQQQQQQQQRQPPPGDYKATFVSIPDFVEKNYIGSNPSRTSQVGCSGSATATLIQLRDPLQEHRHAEVDEAVYVVAGEGTQRIGTQDIQLAAGTFTVIPRGTSHSFTRKGSRPLIVLSILSGEPCSK
jgi:mannose-6-phosphate isomerase-like protein (cupin superfamily)